MDIIDFEVLDMYEQEYIRVQELYQKRKPIVDIYETWNKFWTKYVTFDSSYKFDNIPDRLEWSKLDCVDQKSIVRVGHSACFVLNAILTSASDDHYEGDCIYILGGVNPSQYFPDIHSLTLSSLKWTKIIDNEETLCKYERSTVYNQSKNSIIYFDGANTEKKYYKIFAWGL
ncbi:unnamed protein product [Didymodactylos carnosus]|uniref:Uncharacterized protein n=1 Tax=Didymodactylos carnosus TaxID=1234261 RepID=A0A814M4Y1_9BILA|nr:unnamed protein product [Didymodactylos carnosus]CAF3840175.1 unnamed protein product [Didymodactylos carnosus]